MARPYLDWKEEWGPLPNTDLYCTVSPYTVSPYTVNHLLQFLIIAGAKLFIAVLIITLPESPRMSNSKMSNPRMSNPKMSNAKMSNRVLIRTVP